METCLSSVSIYRAIAELLFFLFFGFTSPATTLFVRRRETRHIVGIISLFGAVTSSPKSEMILPLLFFTLSLLSGGADSEAYYTRTTVCPNTTIYSPNSTYQANLKFLLSSLSSNAIPDSKGFFRDATGQDTDAVYGQYLCRSDVPDDLCRQCVNLASKEIIDLCPNHKVGIIWYDECMLRYSNRSFFNIMEDSPERCLISADNISEPARFNQLVKDTMDGIATRAALDAGKFATAEANFSSSQNLYSLAQCTPDISRTECSRCLEGAINRIQICSDGRGGRVLRPSCNVRYESKPFYQLQNVTTPPSLPPLPSVAEKGGKSSGTILAIVVPITITAVVLFSTLFYCLQRRKRKEEKTEEKKNDGNEIGNPESLQFDLSTILAATNNFADDNKIGKGGFGDVYKGRLANGQEIAVKRLSRNSGQGAEEFKNEVVVVAKLQHRNLIKILGFCLEGEEKILIYEFVPNKSLDYFLFDPNKCAQLDWPRRYKIISGIARGLLYFHEDSRLKIIHRDLKASNILLDEEMNPKISDFGMARIFGIDQTQANTERIAGTHGYMAPEYAMHGKFSVKSDVYSFGVLLLEIISGRKNSSLYPPDHVDCLLSYAWRQWKQGTAFELMDPILKECCSRNEVMRCIHIGLLCVQEDKTDRPTMALVVIMPNTSSFTLPLPSQPAFLVHSRSASDIPNQPTRRSIPLSTNEMSITMLDPR